ncbi:hypothetical protein PENARI_c005G08159 [Penicillium arizonense]|uniref:Cation-transporting P-type ATPase C-terminal domain-containing protein n=1 Tax=Penicillium arizonense TaxID=1835702 RepID=A0A1F5LPG1_PENAI|nr:hypothetical protein PENARI_c005G08159 [Penicillium arizonense]OGE54819.1 hypothetical protein PENARI_c005G08159 [Penicillium arizonense]
MTGDREAVALDIARHAGIMDTWHSLSPIEKVQQLQKLRAEGKIVAMVGDGINDAAALAAADVSIALQSGSSIPMASADVVLLNSSLRDIYIELSIGHHATKTMKSNVYWAYLYNAGLMPLAMGFNGWSVYDWVVAGRDGKPNETGEASKSAASSKTTTGEKGS